jgi:hypothetical protein
MAAKVSAKAESSSVATPGKRVGHMERFMPRISMLDTGKPISAATAKPCLQAWNVWGGRVFRSVAGEVAAAFARSA